ncbi:serine/threonine protein kinase [Plesiocystis pacifica SIR-1]|uniref:Serine/threonine protein kinase n=1 Tax=Plesiocystis pacifica SIR-1 TaxID=391625 RepID=A6GIN1_9BACT|nr:serine/threonine protein kinase [Plesiocystis pacifica SIR-1]
MHDVARPPVSLGRHRLLFAIGHGGMSDVYLALVNSAAGVNKLLVVKKLRASLLDEPEALSMFMDEARLAARLHHPNVVQTFEVGREGPIPYLTMEFLDGQPLHRVLRRLGVGERTDPALASVSEPPDPLTLGMRLRVITEMLEGLHYAHELRDYDGTPMQVVHRDVSPQNLFITYDGQIKLVDFGIAKAADSVTHTQGGGLKGKLAYMSPQQAEGQAVDRRADVFAAGVMLWEMLSGRRLWAGRGQVPIARRLVDHDLPNLDVEGVPRALIEICAKAMAPAVHERYATAEQFQLELEAFMDETGLDASIRSIGKRVAQAFAAERRGMRHNIDSELLRLVGDGEASVSPVQLWHEPYRGEQTERTLGSNEVEPADPDEETANIGPAEHVEMLALPKPGRRFDPEPDAGSSMGGTFGTLDEDRSGDGTYTGTNPGLAAELVAKGQRRMIVAVVATGLLASGLSVLGSRLGPAVEEGGEEGDEEAQTERVDERKHAAREVQDVGAPPEAALLGAGDCDRDDKPVVELSGEIDEDATLRCDRDYLLRFHTRVASGATLTIEPGTIIRGDRDTKGTLIVEPGARLIARGTQDAPIVFTSSQPLGARAPGDWGGVVLLGNAPINLRDARGEAIRGRVEGLTVGGSYGGDDIDDDSGELRYVRIEYPGVELAPSNELNGLTLAGVGRGTILDHVQVRATTDDCFEFFGGTVDGRYLVCDEPGDDGFDFDYGYQGRLQHLVVRDARPKAAGSHAFEVDNDPNGTSAEPRTRPELWNATLCGASSTKPKPSRAILVRRAATPVFHALVVGGFDRVIEVRDEHTRVELEGLALLGATSSTGAAPTEPSEGFDELAWLAAPERGVVRNPSGAPDCATFGAGATMVPAAPLALATSATSPAEAGSFFEAESAWLGAFGSEDWTAGWVVWGK